MKKLADDARVKGRRVKWKGKKLRIDDVEIKEDSLFDI